MADRKPTREALAAAMLLREREPYCDPLGEFAALIDSTTHLPELLAVVEAAREACMGVGCFCHDPDPHGFNPCLMCQLSNALTDIDAARERNQ